MTTAFGGSNRIMDLNKEQYSESKYPHTSFQAGRAPNGYPEHVLDV